MAKRSLGIKVKYILHLLVIYTTCLYIQLSNAHNGTSIISTIKFLYCVFVA
jgi:hypothetical protein